MEIAFNGKRAIVTGAGRGIGRELAKRLDKYGAKVFALSKTQANLNSLKKECPKMEIIVVDITNWEATKAAIGKIGPVDFLVNNAALMAIADFGTITEDSFDKIISANLKAPVNIMQEVVKGMKERGAGGSIVNVTGSATVMSNSKFVAYTASKVALDRISKMLAADLGSHKIRVNCVNPGLVDTEKSAFIINDEQLSQKYLSKIPLGVFATSSNTVDSIVFLLSDKAEMVNGTNIFVDGGLTAR